MPTTQVVPINTFSDGDPTQIPKKVGNWQDNHPKQYLEKLAHMWMKHRGELVDGVDYVLDSLPDGYTLWAKQRSTGIAAGQVDRKLFGHPSGHYFDSIPRFFPHFLHLMEHGTSDGCPCTVCNSQGGKILPIGQSRFPRIPGPPKPRGRPPLHAPREVTAPAYRPKGRPRLHDAPPPVDTEGTPDIYRILIDRLRKESLVDCTIEENLSLDWRVEHERLSAMLSSISTQPAWMPRLGEIVLFIRKLDKPGVLRRITNGAFRIYNLKSEKWEDFPNWEAGVVTQVSEEELDIDELVLPVDRSYPVTQTGFRIEPISDPNSKDKPYSRQYTYVPLHQMKPFAMWKEILRGIPELRWHETVQNAKAVCASVTLVGKHHFKGAWPSAEVSCKGVYIGSELIVPGDTVCLTPPPPPGDAEVTDVLRIKAIKLQLSSLDEASSNDSDEGHPYNSNIVVIGKAYTTDGIRAHARPVRPSSGLLPVGIHDYGAWYTLHAENRSLQVPFTRILGRCYPQKALRLLLYPNNSSSEPQQQETVNLSYGLGGILAARKYAAGRDARISRSGRNWLWADTRAESLDLDILNGMETAQYDSTRDAKQWVRFSKELDGIANEEDKKAMIDAERSKKSFGGLASQSTMVRTALEADNLEEGIEDEMDLDDEGAERASKRSRSEVVASRERSEVLDEPASDVDQVVSDLIGGKGFPEDADKDQEMRESEVEDSVQEESEEGDDDVVMLDRFQSRT